MGALPAARMPDQHASITVPVTEEELDVQRRTVDTGHAVRIRKDVLHEEAHVDLSSVRENVQIERVPIGRVVESPPSMRQEGDVTVIPVLEEREVVVKQLVLVEELRLTRTREAVPATGEVLLRKERVKVERYDPVSGEWLPEEA